MSLPEIQDDRELADERRGRVALSARGDDASIGTSFGPIPH